MKPIPLFITALSLILPGLCQQITEAWQTTWDQHSLLTNVSPSPAIQFGSPGAAATADIQITDSQTFQTVLGFGGSLTESSAKLLSQLKSQNPNNYNDLMHKLFDITDGQATAGLSYIRVPISASDFSSADWTMVSNNADPNLSTFNMDNAPSYIYSTLLDIVAINPTVRFHILAWSPPGWMKDSGTMQGGNFLSQHTNTYANYLLKVVQGLKSKGINVYAVSVQNEPANSTGSYPSCKFSSSQEAAVAQALRPLLNQNGFNSVVITAMDHNWSMTSSYAIPAVQAGGNAYGGASFHCYGGNPSDMATFHNAFPNLDIYFTECTGEFGDDSWGSIKWWTDHLTVGSIEQNARSVLLWNIALDGSGEPRFPGTSSCSSPKCRGIVTVNSGGSYTLNPEYFTLAQASRAVTPKDQGGPWGQRLGVSVQGSMNWALRVTAFKTGRSSSSNQDRYSLLVMNWNDNVNGNWNPQPVKATIEFRGKQATYTFPVGTTTLAWYA